MKGPRARLENAEQQGCEESRDHLFFECDWANALGEEIRAWIAQEFQLTHPNQWLQQVRRKHQRRLKKGDYGSCSRSTDIPYLDR